MVTATASSKKKAKNLAAIEMMQKLSISGDKTQTEVEEEGLVSGEGQSGNQGGAAAGRGEMLERLVEGGLESILA